MTFKFARSTNQFKTHVGRWNQFFTYIENPEAADENAMHIAQTYWGLPAFQEGIKSLVTLGYDTENPEDLALFAEDYGFGPVFSLVVTYNLPPVLAHALVDHLETPDSFNATFSGKYKTQNLSLTHYSSDLFSELYKENPPENLKEIIDLHQGNNLGLVEASVAAYHPHLLPRIQLAKELGQSHLWALIEDETIDLRMADEVLRMDLMDDTNQMIAEPRYSCFVRMRLLLAGLSKDEIVHIVGNYPYWLWADQCGYSADEFRMIDIEPQQFVRFCRLIYNNSKKKPTVQQIIGAVHDGVTNMSDFKRAAYSLGFKPSQITENFEAVLEQWKQEESERYNQ